MDSWPELPLFADWEDTHTTLHMWMQIVGKVRLELGPHINHSWGVALYLTSRGVTTSPIPYPSGSFAIDFDFIEHQLIVSTSIGQMQQFALQPMTVSEFYGRFRKVLEELEFPIKIYPKPVEVVESIPFPEDTKHQSYDPEKVRLFWTVLLGVEHVFADFRARFIGKVSPVHLFWGAMDLAVTRFSGRPAPKHPGGIPNCADRVMVEAYSHELSSAGFWAGAGLGEPAFYSYAYPAPAEYRNWQVKPASACFHEGMGEFILPYAAIREDNPKDVLLTFLQSTYEAAATLGHWDRQALER